MPPSAPVEEEDSGPLNLSTPYPITLYRVALNNVNIKIDDTTVSVLDFTSGLNWQEKNADPDANLAAGAADCSAESGGSGAGRGRRTEDSEPAAGRKAAGRNAERSLLKPVLPEMTDVHLPLNLNIEEFRGEQLRVTGDTDLTVYNMLLKVSSIDGNMKLDALDIDSNQGSVNASGTAHCADTGRWISR
jgi:translocation and assembly module TamB